MNVMSSGYESGAEPMSTQMSEDICDGSDSHLIINRTEVRYKMGDCIKQGPEEQKCALLSTQNMGKGLHKVFKAVVNENFQALLTLVEFGSEFSYFIPEPGNFSDVTRLSEDINKPWIKESMKGIKNSINYQTFLVQEIEKGEPLTPCIDVYKAKIQYDGSLDKLRLRILVREDLHNKELVGDTQSSIASMRT